MVVEQAGSERELAAMRRAISLADRGAGSTSPNPVVGCVVLDAEQRVVGEGFHEHAGGPHAEVVALVAAGAAARGGTLVVTLEPCAHTGRTGPCTQAIEAAGIARVVYAVADPTPVAAGGAQVLRGSGLDVVGGVLAAQAAAANEAWLHRVRTGRPFVTWKYAATLDGRVCAADGSSRWITGTAARRDVHLLRSRSDAVMVGTGTALADDPALTTRLEGVSTSRQPLRVVVGRRDLPADARVLDGSAPTLQVREHDPALVVATLAERGVASVLLEGGPTLAGAFIEAGLVDRVVCYVAPMLLGAGAAALGEIGVKTLGDASRWHIDEVDLVGDDVRVVARPRQPEG